MSVALGMTAAEILKFIIDNAPAEIAGFEALIHWVSSTATSFYDSWTKPLGTVTQADLVAHLDKIKANDAKIEATK